MIDTHCHLDFPAFAGRVRRVLDEAAAAGVTAVINPGTSRRSSELAIALAEEQPAVWAAVGIHPTEKETVSMMELDEWRALAAHRRVVAIGEVGLDFHHMAQHPDETPTVREQRALFEQFVLIAEEASKPLLIHARAAHREALSVVQAVASAEPVLVFHSFDGDQETARLLLDAGAYLGFNNLLSYPKNEALREVAAWAPLDRLLLETDGPFLPPADRRGGQSAPADVKPVAEELARLHRVSVEDVDRITTNTGKSIFGLLS